MLGNILLFRCGLCDVMFCYFLIISNTVWWQNNIFNLMLSVSQNGSSSSYYNTKNTHDGKEQSASEKQGTAAPSFSSCVLKQLTS